MAGDPPGYMDGDWKEFESPLPSRMKYSSPSRSRMGPDCCCWEFGVWGTGRRRAPPGLSIARHSWRGKKATSRITVVPSKLSFISGYQQESAKETNPWIILMPCLFSIPGFVLRKEGFTHVKQPSHECNVEFFDFNKWIFGFEMDKRQKLLPVIHTCLQRYEAKSTLKMQFN